ncbi:M20 family metallo-hydrolase [Bacillus sp. V5-8f]|uniref:M20 family metallo-hydrolase n=1 Tax=Bacillus sp. V5-8f TaxID=2053044 RepID=UPI000C76AA28|nr:M20 family metallo-hydrolase [Bacillus sp. V5-8f]PLT35428.1 Zn-dependent hydrolase [Bacillus sp. V5-8f]
MIKTHAINTSRLQDRIEKLAQIGKIGDTGVCRLALSKEDRKAVDVVKGWMEEAGMETRIDHFGNLIGRMEGKNPDKPIIMLGSHIDSQPYGGRFDGAIGVLGAIEAVQAMAEKKIVPEAPIEVVAFCDEEGCRFNKGIFGVRGIWGALEPGELDRKDKDGITRRQALIDFGCDPEKFSESEYKPGSVAAFLELHIEQGPVLDRLQEPIGIVTGISGPLWLTVEMTGFAGHAGSVPMPMRQDALLGSAKVIVALNEIATQEQGSPTVATVGNIEVFPNSRNIIPEKVTFTVDLRDIELERRDRYEKQLHRAIQRIAEEHKLTVSISEDTNTEPRYCADWIKDMIRDAAGKMGYKPTELMSGPFHDSLVMSNHCDYGMIFVRCKDGISHNPLESSTHEDIAIGTELLYQTVLGIIQRK